MKISNLEKRYEQDENALLTSLEGNEFEIPMYSEVCNVCNHIKDYRECKAFDEIPLEIWNGNNPHTEPYAGQ